MLNFMPNHRCWLLLIVAWIAGCASVSPDERLRQQANAAHRHGDYAAARSLYDQALQVNPANGNLWNDRGVLKRTTGDLAGSTADFEQGIRVAPGYGTLYYQRGYNRVNGITVRSTPGAYTPAAMAAALADYERALQLNPADADARLGRFIIFIVQRDARSAEAEIVRWMKVDRPIDDAIWIAILHVLRHEDAEADKVLERLYRRHPDVQAETARDLAPIRAAAASAK